MIRPCCGWLGPPWQLRVDLEGALELYDKSLAINPNCAQALTVRGWALAWAGRSDEAIPSLLQALRLSPFDPEAFFVNDGGPRLRLHAHGRL